MAHIPLVDHSPEAMTRRARWYLSVAAIRHLTLGVFCLIAPWLFANAAFIPILNFVPLWGWGSVMAATGATCAVAAAFRHGGWARLAMVCSATVTIVLGAGVTVGVAIVWAKYLAGTVDTPASPVLPVLLLALAAKDYIVCGQPIRSPFETVLNRLVRAERAK
jgi:hypothetical protein